MRPRSSSYLKLAVIHYLAKKAGLGLVVLLTLSYQDEGTGLRILPLLQRSGKSAPEWMLLNAQRLLLSDDSVFIFLGSLRILVHYMIKSPVIHFENQV